MRPVAIKKDQRIYVIGFLSLSLIIYAVFFFYPLLQSLFISFTEFKLAKKSWKWVGLKNYARVLSDKEFPKILSNTFIYSIIYIPCSIGFGMTLAILVDHLEKSKSFFRVALFIPVIIASSVAASVIGMLLNQHTGYLISLLSKIFDNVPIFLTNPDYVLPSVALIGVWRMSSYVFLFYSAALQSRDKNLLEAATIDGAGPFYSFWLISFPLLSKTHKFVLFITMTASFQSFETIHILTRGGPNNHSNVLFYRIYQEGFKFYNMGRASALATMVIVLVLLIYLLPEIIKKKGDSNVRNA